MEENQVCQRCGPGHINRYMQERMLHGHYRMFRITSCSNCGLELHTERRYGVYLSDGAAEDTVRCIALVRPCRRHSFNLIRQCSKKRGQRTDGLYCSVHSHY